VNVTRGRALTALTAGAATLLSATRTAAQDAPLRVVAFPIDSSCEPYFAVDQGFFKDAGLNVTLVTGANGPAVAAGVVSGDIDIGLGNVVSLAQARARNVPFVIVAPASDYLSNAPTTLAAVPRASELKRPRDLTGKTVGITVLNGLPHYSFRLWIDKDGGDSSLTKFVELSYPDMLTGLARDRIDAAFVSEPFIGPARAGGRILGAPLDAIGRPFPVALFFAAPAWVQSHGPAVKKFSDTIRRTGAWANRNHEKSAEILAKISNMDRDVVRTMTRAVFADHIDPLSIQSLLDLAARYGNIPSFRAEDFLAVSK
jgi:NitT/TauT family transport system substrate-binding protein